MKKGEIKKQEFIRTAEMRFCRDGFENTSIQDILNDLHTSKGSFYHHFISKEALLEEICKSRALNTSEMVFRNMMPQMQPLDKLNMLISGMIPFTGEKLTFLLMLIPIFSGPEGITIRNFYKNELEQIYLEPVSEALRAGTEQGIYSCKDSLFSAQILILLINRFWTEICDRILENEKKGNMTDPSDLMNTTENYRTSAERLLSAPFGSLNIIQLPELQALSEQIHLHWKN